MRRYVDILGGISPTVGHGKRVADVVAALTPPPKDVMYGAPAASGAPVGNPGVALVKTGPSKAEIMKEAAVQLVPGVGVGLAGAFVGSKLGHPVLGFLGGAAIGSNALTIYKGGPDRRKAICRLGVESAAIGAVLATDRGHPIVRYVIGGILGGIASAFVPGSDANAAWQKFMGK